MEMIKSRWRRVELMVMEKKEVAAFQGEKRSRGRSTCEVTVEGTEFKLTHGEERPYNSKTLINDTRRQLLIRHRSTDSFCT